MHFVESILFLTSRPNIDVSGSASQAAYGNLESWLRKYASEPWDMPQTRVSLGPKGSYFAVSPAGGVTWNSIPKLVATLIDINQHGRTPTLVALGVKETWFALWPDGSSSCNLDSEYPDLETLLRRRGTSSITVSSRLQRLAVLHNKLLNYYLNRMLLCLPARQINSPSPSKTAALISEGPSRKGIFAK